MEGEHSYNVLRLLYPNDTFKTGTIRGYNQSDWQYYITKGNVDINLLEALYFGKIADITVNDGKDVFSDVITHDVLWEAERSGLKEFFREMYGIPKNENIHIWRADGMKKIIDWKEVL